jgi:hypothetical protein
MTHKEYIETIVAMLHQNEGFLRVINLWHRSDNYDDIRKNEFLIKRYAFYVALNPSLDYHENVFDHWDSTFLYETATEVLNLYFEITPWQHSRQNFLGD